MTSSVNASEPRRFSPSAQRNTAPILAVLERILPPSGLVLEIACGSGQHSIAFAEHFDRLMWQPTDADPEAIASTNARRVDAECKNLAEAISLDVENDWTIPRADAVVCINMVHISPWSATVALFRGAAQLLPTDGSLVLYGPYEQTDEPLAQSNVAFDRSLRSRNPAWGIRKLASVSAVAQESGFSVPEVVAMPANNLLLVYKRL